MTRRLAGHGPFAVRLCNWIGDVVLSLPALELLASRGLDLRLYGRGWAPTLLSGYDWPIVVRGKSVMERHRQLREIRQACLRDDPRFGSRAVNALVMPNSISSASELRIAGFRVSGMPHEARSIFLSHIQPERHDLHKVEWFWTLASAILGESSAPPRSIGMRLADAAVARADALIREQGLNEGFIAVAPFAGGTADGLEKKWPHFPEFARRLADFDLPIVVCPGPEEEPLARAHYAGLRSLNGVALDTYAALLARASLVVANDTGPAHIAAAVGAPLLSVLGPTRAEVWLPWGPTVSKVQQWPVWPSVDDVLAEVERRLRQPLPVR